MGRKVLSTRYGVYAHWMSRYVVKISAKCNKKALVFCYICTKKDKNVWSKLFF